VSVPAAVAGAFALFLVYAVLVKWRLDRRPAPGTPAAVVGAVALVLVCALAVRLHLDRQPASRAHRPPPRRRKAHS
jgi:hypothetical protein